VNCKLALASVGALLAGAVLCAQPPADSFEASPDFEASVKAAMAPSIAQQRAAIQKQASSFRATGLVPAGASPLVSRLTGSAFFTTPFPPVEAGTADCDPLPADQLDGLIEAAAQKTGVEAQLVRTVIHQESAGRPCALSAKGAQGLMQLMPATAEEFEVDDPFDPKQNVEAGAKLLKSLLERYKNDPALALSAYNAGPERVDQEGGIPHIPETMDYVTAILGKLRSLTDSKTANGSTESSSVTPTKNFGW
jgi:soluble lytic murein transglycosylase-like protein